MAWVGSAFQRLYTWVTDRDANIPITASRMDAEMDGIATGISQCIHKGGNNAATANLPMGGFKHTNCANASARTDYATAAQVQDGGMSYAVDTGAADAYVVTLSPAITAYATGMVLSFKSTNANTGASTINVNGVGAKTIKKWNDRDLEAGDIESGGVYQIQYDGTNFQLVSPVSSGHPLVTANGVLAPHKNLKITNTTASTSTNQIDLTADELLLTDGSGNYLKVTSVSISDADITTNAQTGPSSGYANGYTRGADEWAYMWVVSNGANTYLLFDEVGTAPDLTGFTGYYYGLVGAVRNTSSAFVDFLQVNTSVAIAQVALVTAGIATAWTSLNSTLATIVPPNASMVTGYAFCNDSSGTSVVRVSSHATLELGKQNLNNAGGSSANAGGAFNTLIFTSQTIYYQVGSGDAGTVVATGFMY